jgi:hypothetical protein
MRKDLQDRWSILEGNNIYEGLATRAKGYGKVKVSEPGCVERTS